MKALLLGLGALLLMALPAMAQTSDESALKEAKTAKAAKPKGVAHVRILHAIAGAFPADFYFNGHKVAEKMKFKTLSDYLEVESGKTVIKMTGAGTAATIVDGTATFTRDGFYTIAPYGTMDKARLVSQNDNTGKSDEKKVRIRVFHLAPGASKVTIAVPAMRAGNRIEDGALDIIKNLEYGEDTTKLIEPGETTLQVRAGSKVVKVVPGVTLEAGKRYAIFAVGKPGIVGPQAFDVLIAPMGTP